MSRRGGSIKNAPGSGGGIVGAADLIGGAGAGEGNKGNKQLVGAGSLEIETGEVGGDKINDTATEASSTTSPSANNTSTLDERYAEEQHNLRIRRWMESPYACGLTETTWGDEKASRTVAGKAERRRHRQQQQFRDEFNPDTSGCLCCSAYMCTWLGATRVGNMAVLKSSTEWVEEDELDEETGEPTGSTRRTTRPRLDWLVGPFWPMLVFVTYPIIFVVSGLSLFNVILPGGKPVIVVLGWVICTVGLIAALAFTGCRDPGILLRHEKPPPGEPASSWRWSDAAQSYRPRDAHYDTDTAVVVEGFDHTCPWTGTAIGKRNMAAFQMFVSLVFVCMIFNIFLLTGVV